MLEIPSSAASPPSSSTSTCTRHGLPVSMGPLIPTGPVCYGMGARLDEDCGIAVLLGERLKCGRNLLARPAPDGREI